MSESGTDEIDTLVKLKQLENKIPVLILTDNGNDQQAINVFRLGARGYLSKSCTPAEFSDAVCEILSTGFYHNNFFILSLTTDGKSDEKKKTEKIKVLESLSAKERQFLKLVACEKEFMYTEIAEKMQLSVRAVDKCREELFIKLNIKSKAGLVIFVYQHDLYDLL